MFERYDQKIVVSPFYGRFNELLAIVLGSKAIYLFQSYDQKIIFLAFYGHFHELLPKVLGFQGGLHV